MARRRSSMRMGCACLRRVGQAGTSLTLCLLMLGPSCTCAVAAATMAMVVGMWRDGEMARSVTCIGGTVVYLCGVVTHESRRMEQHTPCMVGPHACMRAPRLFLGGSEFQHSELGPRCLASRGVAVSSNSRL